MIKKTFDEAILYGGSVQVDYIPPAEWADEIIDHLIDSFPELEDEINKEIYYNFSAHLVFDMILFPRVMEWAENSQTEKLKKFRIYWKKCCCLRIIFVFLMLLRFHF